MGAPECTLDHKVHGVESPQLDARDEDEDEYEDEYGCDEDEDEDECPGRFCGEDEDEDEDEDEYPGRFCVRAVVVGGVSKGSTNAVEGISMGIA